VSETRAKRYWFQLLSLADCVSVDLHGHDHSQTAPNDASGEEAPAVTDTDMLQSFYLHCRIKALREKTLAVYAERLSILLTLARHRQKRLCEMERSDIESYIISTIDRLSPHTINGRLRVWRVFYHFAVEDHLLDHDPLERMSLLKVDFVRKPVLKPEQLDLFLRSFDKHTYAGQRNRLFTLLLLDTAVRVGEALRIRIEDIDMTGGLVEVKHTKGRRERVVPISYATIGQIHKFTAGKRKRVPGPLLFCKTDGIRLNVGRINKIFYRRSGQIGVRVYPHLIRHTSLTMMADGGMPLHYIQRIAGHADIRTTHMRHNDRYVP